MTVSPVSKLYSTEDCKIAALLTDVAGFASYDTEVDVPGIRAVTMTPQIESKELRGDNRLLDADSTLVGVELSATHAKLSLEALEVILGGAYTPGVATAGYVQAGGIALPKWAIGWRTPDNGGDTTGGDVHFRVAKCVVTAFQLGTAQEDYQELSFSAKGFVRLADDRLFDLGINATAAAISL